MGHRTACMLLICIPYHTGFDSLALLNHAHEDAMTSGPKML